MFSIAYVRGDLDALVQQSLTVEAHVPDYSRPDGSPSVFIRLAWEDQDVPFAETDSHATGETEANRMLSV